MDEATIKELIKAAITETLTPAIENLKGEMIAADRGVAAKLENQIKSLRTESQPETGKNEVKTESSLQDKELSNRLKILEDQLKQKEAEVARQEKTSAIRSILDSQKVTATNVLTSYLLNQYGENATKENGEWYITTGNTVSKLDSAIKQFLDSEEGSAFKPTKVQKGFNFETGSTDPQNVQIDTKNPDSIRAALSAAFSKELGK